ncbi:MAG: aspartate kinase, partial [Candidatus Levybacteria bacterium]|nr:aspartate kinase [Candidatus Levybacteria bacterium]
MISIADVVSDLVKTSPFLEEALTKNIISYSALSRELKPQIEKKLSKEIKRGAIVMALKRITQKLKLAKTSVKDINSIGDLTIRSNLTALTFVNSDTMAEKQRILFSRIENKKDMFVNLSQGIREITFIV